MIEAALSYTKRNGNRPALPIFPLRPRGKAPLIGADRGGRGCHDATSDPETVRQWWTQWPDANIGIATGGGIVVLDIDIDHDGGKFGDESLSQLEDEHGLLPDTWEALTGRGGRHIYFQCDDAAVTVGTNIRNGIDFRGAGGYVVAPPSIHENGHRYEWEAGHSPADTPLAPLPEWLHEIMVTGTAKARTAPAEIPEKIRSGERNDQLFKTACSLRAKGLTEKEILGALREMNAERCDPPVKDYELVKLVESAGKYQRGNQTREEKKQPPDVFLSCFKTLDSFEEQEATWLVPGWIPEGQITLMAADGGIGKTTLWCNLIAALSSGGVCLLDPPGYQRAAQTVAFMTTEDSVRKKLHKKLRLAGADMKRIISPDFAADREGVLRDLKFGTIGIEHFVRHFRPALCVFDPVQGFVPPEINMGSRNAMRDCMAPLISLGEETGTTFLVVCHTNKRKGASGRDRIADSADLWDISRSVLMAGYTDEQGIRYLSNEKNNYCQLQESVLFSIDGDGLIHREGTTWKRDREYMADAAAAVSVPKREDCKQFILEELDRAGGRAPVKAIEQAAARAGFKDKTVRDAKDALKNEKRICYKQSFESGSKAWYIERVVLENFVEIQDEMDMPF